jgi:hypothetical protein
MRTLIAYKLWEVSLINEEEPENNIKKNCPSHEKNRDDYESKMGDVIYTFALYKRLKGTSISLNDGHHPDLAVSSSGVIDIAADPDSIIMDKILPVLKQRILTEESVKVDWIEKK